MLRSPVYNTDSERKVSMNVNACFKLSYGVYIVTSLSGEKINGQIANTAFQTTSDPITVAVSINKKNLTHEYISKSGVFTMSILAQDAPLTLIGTFGFKSGRDIDKFARVRYKTGVTKTPIVLDNTVAYLEVKVTKQMELSTHTLFVGEVVDADVLSDDEPMTYAYYHEIKKGKTPKNAATYIEEKATAKSQATDDSMARYVCSVCGYVYDPEKGDPEENIPAGTAFEDLSDDWTCPVCGASKDEFDKG